MFSLEPKNSITYQIPNVNPIRVNPIPTHCHHDMVSFLDNACLAKRQYHTHRQKARANRGFGGSRNHAPVGAREGVVLPEYGQMWGVDINA